MHLLATYFFKIFSFSLLLLLFCCNILHCSSSFSLNISWPIDAHRGQRNGVIISHLFSRENVFPSFSHVCFLFYLIADRKEFLDSRAREVERIVFGELLLSSAPRHNPPESKHGKGRVVHHCSRHSARSFPAISPIQKGGLLERLGARDHYSKRLSSIFIPLIPFGHLSIPHTLHTV
jgi:hypothetical protein